MKINKKSIIIGVIIGTLLLAASSILWKQPRSSKHPKSDTSLIFVSYHNLYQGGSNWDTAIRFIKDSTRINDDDKVEHYMDTVYLLRLSVVLQTKPGHDSTFIKLVPFKPKDIFQTFPPSIPYHPVVSYQGTSDTLAKSKDGKSSVTVVTTNGNGSSSNASHADSTKHK